MEKVWFFTRNGDRQMVVGERKEKTRLFQGSFGEQLTKLDFTKERLQAIHQAAYLKAVRFAELVEEGDDQSLSDYLVVQDLLYELTEVIGWWKSEECWQRVDISINRWLDRKEAEGALEREVAA